MSVREPRRKKRGKARERQAARLRKQSPAPFSSSGYYHPSEHVSDDDAHWMRSIRRRTGMVLRDAGWHIRNNPIVLWGVVFVALTVAALYFLSFMISGEILPRVHSMGVDLGGMTVAEAETALSAAWQDEIRLELTAAGEVVETIPPELLGITFDAAQTAQNARSVRLKAIPFGREIAPVVTIDRLTMQNYLLDLTDRVNILPFSAGFTWYAGELVGVEGYDGRTLDVTLTMEQFARDAPAILSRGRLELLMTPSPPEAKDPTPYLEQAQQLVRQPIQLNGYDPFTNQYFIWPVAIGDFTNWLAVGANSLTLREEAFLPYLAALDETLNPPGETLRYLAPTETTNALREAIASGTMTVDLRIRYNPTVYTVVQGDTSYRISRKTGIPYYLVVEANRGREWNTLSIGDEINIPSRDETMPETPIFNKRIVVDLETQYLVAFEDGQVRFEWPLSTGVTNAPTFPGIFQILDHQPVAYGSSSMLCTGAGIQCGEWAMNWFMGIYEVQEGLVNGFHGDVLLPNGRYLGEGLLGSPATFGCIMSADDEARQLYDWAEVGTVVEIISNEYPPMSDLGALAQEIARERGSN